jgi:hypothetical protein
MTLMWIAVAVGVCALGLFLAARRRFVGGVELGAMSDSWLAEQRAGEQSYYER